MPARALAAGDRGSVRRARIPSTGGGVMHVKRPASRSTGACTIFATGARHSDRRRYRCEDGGERAGHANPAVTPKVYAHAIAAADAGAAQALGVALDGRDLLEGRCRRDEEPLKTTSPRGGRHSLDPHGVREHGCAPQERQDRHDPASPLTARAVLPDRAEPRNWLARGVHAGIPLQLCAPPASSRQVPDRQRRHTP